MRKTPVLDCLNALIDSGEPFTTELIESLGHSRTGARTAIRKARGEGRCHILRWDRAGCKNRPYMVLIGGQGKDAEFPILPPEVKRERMKKQCRKQYYKKKKELGDQWSSKFRKTKYGLHSYILDRLLEAIERGKTFTSRQAAEFAGINIDWAARLLKRAKKAGLIVIVDWSIQPNGHRAVYGWKQEGMQDVPRLGRRARTKKLKAVKAVAKEWGFLYGAARA